MQREWAAGREISQALLTAYLQAEEVALVEPAPGSTASKAFPGFPYLLSLHAFVVTDVELCMPSSDPSSFVKVLAPYLKHSAGGSGAVLRG